MNTYVTGSVIKQLREDCGMTQAGLAEKIGVCGKTVSKWETGKGLPDISLLQPLAQALALLRLEPYIVSESDGMQAEEAAEMKRIYCQLL